MNSQECKIRPQLIDINSNEPSFYSYSIRINKCSGSCNSINDPYAKVFNLMSRTNDRRHIKWHETCKCKCRLDESICNDKQRLNKDKCRCECKELIDKEICEKGFIWNPSNCSCECDVCYLVKILMKMKSFIMGIIMEKYAILVQYT